MVNYFFDTYALIEISRNSPNFTHLIDEVIVTTKFNLAELIFVSLAEFGEEKAKLTFEKFKDSEEAVSDEILFKAMLFRLKHKKKGFSYADCIGYVFAMENNMRFLTGDDAFKGMENVEFVK
ncbi:MAG: PIN domain-containing protein [Candidatus Aenigmarchaeota archaeon]|nr:PIN domain-containing protein [Candidatus Aenigmarchaeota archaeon]